MEKENNMNQDSTYHFGKDEHPFGKDDVSGRTIPDEGKEEFSDTIVEQEMKQSEFEKKNDNKEQSLKFEQNVENPYQSGNVYGQGIYTGNNFQTNDEILTKNKKKKEKKKKSTGKAKKVVTFVCSAIAFGAIAGGVMVGVNSLGNKVLGNDEKVVKEITTVSSTDSSKKDVSTNNVADVAQEVMPSIVAITNTSVQTVRSWFQSYEQEVSGSGSGIIIGQTKKEILIATNNHVIDGAKELTVAFFDETAVEATVKGADPASDLAVIAVDISDVEEDTISSVKVAALGSSDELRAGDFAIAIGNALGYGQSVTVGYISALNREVSVENTSMNLLQTDAAINPGNSGGALLNEKGEVIGINTVKFVDSTVEGMGYAIPISKAIPIINDLMNQEVIKESEQGYLGIQGKKITDQYAQDFNMPKGLYVVRILEGSPADGSGLKAGDIIVKFADRDINSMEALQSILSTKKAGQEIEMVVQRNNEKGDYEEVTIKVVLGAKKEMPEQEEEQSTQQTYPEEYYPNEGAPEEYYDPFADFFNNW